MGELSSYTNVSASQLDDNDEFILNVDGVTKNITAKEVSQVYSDFAALSGTSWDGSNKVKTLTANLALTFSPGNNRLGQLIVIQDATGSRTLSIEGNSIAITSTANAVSVISYIYDAVSSKFRFFVASSVLGLTGTIDTTAPTIVSATAIDDTHVQIVFSETVVPTIDGYTVHVQETSANFSFDSVTGSGTTWTFHTDGTMEALQTLKLNYSTSLGNTLDTAGNELGTVTNLNITNSIGSLTPLSTPTLTATVISDTEIDLSWTNVANESSYKLEWSPNGTTGWTQIGGTIAANTTSYNHTGLTAATHYYYRITAVGDGVTYSDSGYGTDDDTTSAGSFDIMDIAWKRWWDADLGVTTTTSGSDLLVDRIDDQIGNASGSNPTAQDLLQNTDLSKRPKLIASAMNGHDCVETDNLKYLHNSTTIAALPFTVVALVDPKTVSGTWKRILGSQSGAARCDFGYNWVNGTSKMYATAGTGGPLIANTPLIVSDTPIVVILERNGSSNDNIYINETLAVTGDMGGDTDYGGINIGVNSAESANAYWQCGGLFEGILTGTERDNVIAFLKAKAGI